MHRWHGDVPASRKSAVVKTPGGILLITPESLEALFVTRGAGAGSLLAGLQYVVVDELHAFLGTERGAQLRSLLHRVELSLRRRVPRVGLSATLGDMSLAADALRPGEAGGVCCIESAQGGQELAVQVRGYLQAPPRTGDEDGEGTHLQQIAADLLKRAFEGSTRSMMLGALSAQPASGKDLAEIRSLLDELEKRRGTK